VPIKHPLGGARGKILEFEDGTAAYVRSMELTQSFRVHIADVTGFSVTKSGKALQRRLHILGNGSTLASVDVNHGVSELIEAWFRKHKLFHGNVARSLPTPLAAPPPPTGATPSLIADELRKLADLQRDGVLTEEEFETQKAKLLAR
jgi:hypothetical protein